MNAVSGGRRANPLPSQPEQLFALRAEYIFPANTAPLPKGVVVVAGDRIQAVLAADEPCAVPMIDLGPVAILPGLVNAHVHLEFSALPMPILASNGFADWIQDVIGFRRQHPSAAAAVTQGLQESLAAGVTTLAEIKTDSSNVAPLGASAIRSFAFHEVLGISAVREAELVSAATAFLDQAAAAGTYQAGLSPHAPFTVPPTLLDKLVQLAVKRKVPVAMHLAESADEMELLKSGTGPLRKLLEELGVWDAARLPAGRRPLDVLQQLAPAPRVLVIHGTYLERPEWEFMAAQGDRFSVVYCPRTHAHFKHKRHPLVELRKHGIRVAVGTDGRSSNPDLDLLDEVRAVAQEFPSLNGGELLELATIHGAEALGCEAERGSLVAGKLADLCVLALPGYAARDPYELLWHESCPVLATMIGGQWAHVSPQAPAKWQQQLKS